MHTVLALLCFVVVIHWLIFPYPSGLLHWHFGNLTIAPVPAKQPWWIWINTSCEFIMNDCITTTKQITTKLCAYFLGYTVVKSSQFNLVVLHPASTFYIQQKWQRSMIKCTHNESTQPHSYCLFRLDKVNRNWGNQKYIIYALNIVLYFILLHHTRNGHILCLYKQVCSWPSVRDKTIMSTSV